MDSYHKKTTSNNHNGRNNSTTTTTTTTIVTSSLQQQHTRNIELIPTFGQGLVCVGLINNIFKPSITLAAGYNIGRETFSGRSIGLVGYTLVRICEDRAMRILFPTSFYILIQSDANTSISW